MSGLALHCPLVERIHLAEAVRGTVLDKCVWVLEASLMFPLRFTALSWRRSGQFVLGCSHIWPLETRRAEEDETRPGEETEAAARLFYLLHIHKTSKIYQLKKKK